MYNMAYLPQHRNVLGISRRSIILTEFSAVSPTSPTLFSLQQKEKNKCFRSNGVNLVNDCNQQKINDTQGWRAGNSLYNSYFVGDLGTSWETSRDICNQPEGRNVENYLVDRRKLRSLEPTVICHRENICCSKSWKIFLFSDDICIFTQSHNREEINLFLSWTEL